MPHRRVSRLLAGGGEVSLPQGCVPVRPGPGRAALSVPVGLGLVAGACRLHGTRRSPRQPGGYSPGCSPGEALAVVPPQSSGVRSAIA
jgi:hypothetical protein